MDLMLRVQKLLLEIERVYVCVCVCERDRERERERIEFPEVRALYK